jgi:hypothetical protein
LVRPKLSFHTELDGYSKGHSEIKTAMDKKFGKDEKYKNSENDNFLLYIQKSKGN